VGWKMTRPYIKKYAADPLIQMGVGAQERRFGKARVVGPMLMKQQNAIEARRQAIQAALDSSKSAAERNRLGQFATPHAPVVEIAPAVRPHPTLSSQPPLTCGITISIVKIRNACNRSLTDSGNRGDR